MTIEVIRVLRYTYPDEASYIEDKARWTVQNVRIINDCRRIESVVLSERVTD